METRCETKHLLKVRTVFKCLFEATKLKEILSSSIAYQVHRRAVAWIKAGSVREGVAGRTQLARPPLPACPLRPLKSHTIPEALPWEAREPCRRVGEAGGSWKMSPEPKLCLHVIHGKDQSRGPSLGRCMQSSL